MCFPDLDSNFWEIVRVSEFCSDVEAELIRVFHSVVAELETQNTASLEHLSERRYT